MHHRHAIRDEDWDRIKDLLPGREGLRGVTAKDNRLFRDAVLWIGDAGSVGETGGFRERTVNLYSDSAPFAERTLAAYLTRDLAAIWELREKFMARHPEIATHQAVMTKRVTGSTVTLTGPYFLSSRSAARSKPKRA